MLLSLIGIPTQKSIEFVQCVDCFGTWPCYYSPRCQVWRALQRRWRRCLCMGLWDLWICSSISLCRWVLIYILSVTYDHRWKGASSERQPPMYFPLGGGTLKGISKPGTIVWSRVFIMKGNLHADLGLGTVVALPKEEVEKRWKETTSQWPIMSKPPWQSSLKPLDVVLHGVSRDQLMARHKANHAQVAYGDSVESALKAMHVKAAMFQEMGIKVHICGTPGKLVCCFDSWRYSINPSP